MANRGIVIEAQGKAQIAETTIPKLQEDYIRIKPCAVAVNPTDWKHIDILGSSNGYSGATIGCDYAGIVEEVGSKAGKLFKKGDMVYGMCHGANAIKHEGGAFQNNIVAKAAIQMLKPDNLSVEDAATLGVGLITVGQGLYQSLRLPLPTAPASVKAPVLIYGGSTATGSLAIQFARLSGMEVLTVCGTSNFDYVKGLGADAVFDYSDPDCSEKIKQYTKDGLHLVFDCVSKGESTDISIKSMSSTGGTYSTLDPVPSEKVTSLNPNVESKATVAYSALGEDMSLGGTALPAKPEDLDFAQSFLETARKFLAEGRLKAHRSTVNEGGNGLEGVLQGLQLGREGRISGRKLVYTL